MATPERHSISSDASNSSALTLRPITMKQKNAANNENPSICQATNEPASSSTSPPPYTKTDKSQVMDSKPPEATQHHSPFETIDLASTSSPPSPSTSDNPSPNTYQLLKTQLSTYPPTTLLHYTLHKTQTCDAAINKVTRLQQHILTIEKLDRGPARRRRRGLIIVILSLTAIMVTGWSLAGVWKVQRDRAVSEVGELRRVLDMVKEAGADGRVPLSTASGGGTTETRTTMVAVPTTTTFVAPTLTTDFLRPTTKVRGGNEGQNQGLPLDCVDHGGGIVICNGQ